MSHIGSLYLKYFSSHSNKVKTGEVYFNIFYSIWFISNVVSHLTHKDCWDILHFVPLQNVIRIFYYGNISILTSQPHCKVLKSCIWLMATMLDRESVKHGEDEEEESGGETGYEAVRWHSCKFCDLIFCLQAEWDQRIIFKVAISHIIQWCLYVY